MRQSSGDHYSEGFVFKYILSCCAATIAETVTYPLDLTKTRLQIQGEGSRKSAAYRGMVRTAYGIATEGLLKLWQGVTPAIYRHFVYSGCRMGFYEWIRDNLLGKNPNGTYSLWKASLSGLSAGAAAQFIASPTDLIKVQMQMEGRKLLDGKLPRFRNTWHAFTVTVSEGGVWGLWKGWVPNVQRAALVNLGDLTTYDTAKHLILTRTSLKDNPVTHTLASACSGLVSAILGTPADVVKTRIMNQQYINGRGALYSSSVDCLVKTVQIEGFWALYKGFLPIWARMAPWSLVFWLSYEQIRRLAGTSSF
jgi:solute carrier family 25 uncoupling protein 27